MQLNPRTLQLARALVAHSGGSAQVVEGDGWLSVEEAGSAIAFIEAAGDELNVVPFNGNPAIARGRPFVTDITSSWLEADALVVDMSRVATAAHEQQLMAYLREALTYWERAAAPPDSTPTLDEPAPLPPIVASGDDEAADLSDLLEDDGDEPAVPDQELDAQLRADVSPQWSWASSAARIPQVSDLVLALSAPLEQARITVTVKDDDVVFGTVTLPDGALPAGTHAIGSLHVPLSARVMSQVRERQGALCLISLEDVRTGKTVARLEEAVDVQPRDLWNWDGDPRRSEQRARMERRHDELVALLQSDTAPPDAEALLIELQQLVETLNRSGGRSIQLARALLASFVRPNHPEIAVLAREAADARVRLGGEASFHAFQLPERDAQETARAGEEVDRSIAAVYDTLRAREIAYSEPPPGWDYTTDGQRIRDHGDVARAGLGTCMDTTVLMAAVIEHIGLHPVLVLVPGHIFIGYWRRDPDKSGAGSSYGPDWYPRAAVLHDAAATRNLVEGGYLGVIETTSATVGADKSPGDARAEAHHNRLASGLTQGNVTLIDVAAARRGGVSPLPAVNDRPDGVTEVIEYRPGGAPPAVTEVETAPISDADRERRVDTAPPRYRTWKSSLFSLNATNDLLNLKSNARVQPIILPSESIGVLEDRLNQDVAINLHSGFDLPEVWQARDAVNALILLHEGDAEARRDLAGELEQRRVYVQRIGRSGGEPKLLSHSTFVKEIRSMANQAKTARDERGMNPLYLCLGMFRWEYKPGVFADAPLILVPVTIGTARGRAEFSLKLDTSQQTTPNVALIEWLRREHGLTVPALVEPLTDHAGIDVDGVIAAVRDAVISARLAVNVEVVAEARLATLDLSAFRMWQDLNIHAERFIEQPLVGHLVHSPTDQFEDPAVASAGDAAGDVAMADELEKLETPIPADSTQKRAVLWARQGRTFVLQGPPGTGKSQTITNMVAECLLTGMRVLFVAEKGTALSVVQRRLESIGLGPFTLNLHHEGSNATEVRKQLKRALTASVVPDPVAMESARRRLRTARFELQQYPDSLHATNAADLSAYSAHDELLVLGDGPAIELPSHLVAHQPETIQAMRELFEDLQPWTAAAGVRPDHPWRFAGIGAGEPFDLDVVSRAVTGVLDGAAWAAGSQDLGDVLQEVVSPAQLVSLLAGADPRLPQGLELDGVLAAHWPAASKAALSDCERTIAGIVPRLHGFNPTVLAMDVRLVAGKLEEANASGMLGRGKRQTAALAPLVAQAPPGLDLQPARAAQVLHDLIAAQDAATSVRTVLSAVPGLSGVVPDHPFMPGALEPVRMRLADLDDATGGLRGSDQWRERVRELARAGRLAPHRDRLIDFTNAWVDLRRELDVSDDDYIVWLAGRSMLEALGSVRETWRRQVEFERLLPLQQWCTLVRKLTPLRQAGLLEVRAQLLDGSLPSYVAEDALARGVARASLAERVSAAGLDRFDAVAHDLRVTTYSGSQGEVREQWVTDGPTTLLERRGASGAGRRTGGLARELEKTTRRLGTRPILRKYGEAVQELTPLVLCSPSSAVDLIEPGMMEFDVVIFDEASQITVPEAVGALGRARAAIVVGDTKQMPPTRKIAGSAGGEDEIDDVDAEEIVEDQESILSECELARVPTLSLSWHYRSQDEALIAFSNRTYYRGDLSSFPTPTLMSSETGVEFRKVDGQYLRAGSGTVELTNGITAGSNTNPIEAMRIVEAVHDLVHASDRLPSVGIVTFNEQQRQLIEDLLNSSPDPLIAAVMDEATMGRGEALFVKALEQVQGDERDVIIFSIAFSKQGDKIPTNFGPLTNAGGERRLNVAVTRARRKNVVYCSFEPHELKVENATYNGPKDLKEFLLFVKAAGSEGETEGAPGRVPVRDRHRDDVAAALRDAGLHVMSDVGLSNFRLDLVLSRPEDPARPLLPVLLDGESWRSRQTVSDRDVLPVEVLQNLMGWPSVARVWWPMWLQNRQAVIDALVAAVDDAEQVLATTAASPAMGVVPAGAIDDAPVDMPVEEVVEMSPAEVAEESTPGSVIDSHLEAEELAGDAAAPASNTREQVAPFAAPAAIDYDPVKRVRPATDSTADPRERSVFVPAGTDAAGPRDVLDALPDKDSAQQVRAQLLDVIDIEGPVEIGRLTRIVARRFGLNAVRTARAAEISRLVPRGQVSKGRLGTFAWPADVDPDSWTGFRTVDLDATRSLDEIAPQEIANAMRSVLADEPDGSAEQVMRGAAELFGITRLGANVRARLEAVHKNLPIDDPE